MISTDKCNTIFCFHEDYGVLICKQHRTGALNLDRHLREQHGTLIAQRRQVLVAQYATIEPSAVELPEQPAAPIQELGVPLDGMKCRACSFITVNTGNMKNHCRKSHQLSWTDDKSTLYESVKVQTFFSGEGLQEYFVVDLDIGESEKKSDSNQVIQQQLNAYQEVRQQLEEDLLVMEEAAKTDKTGWFKKTGWLVFF
jgi:hypothetical protein